MCGEKLKAVLRANREIADKKNEEIFSKKRATMGDDEVTQSSASASASASTSAVVGESMRIKTINYLLYGLLRIFICVTSPDICSDFLIFSSLIINFLSISRIATVTRRLLLYPLIVSICHLPNTVLIHHWTLFMWFFLLCRLIIPNRCSTCAHGDVRAD